MLTEAENFNGPYPLAGERIGPAWRELWRLLSQDEWLNGGDAAVQLAPRFGIEPGTVKALLRQATKAGVLEATLRKPEGRKRESAHYRVVKA